MGKAQVLITGASGFVGRNLLRELQPSNISVTATVRSINRAEELRSEFPSVTVHVVPEHADLSHWVSLLEGLDAIVHLGGLAHITNPDARIAASSSNRIQAVNVDWSILLARAARIARVKRFIYQSSIKAVGDSTNPGRPFTISSIPCPSDEYGRSKLEAERGITRTLEHSDIELFILRTPLIYGPEVKANFLALLKAASWRLPIPVRSIENRRSLLYVRNLTNLIAHLLMSGARPGTYLISDGEPISTGRLISLIAQSLGVGCYTLPFPRSFLMLSLRLLKKEELVEKLIGDLEIDSTESFRALNWEPPIDATIGIKTTTDWYQFHTVNGH